MPWLGKIEKPFGDEPKRVKTHASIILGCELVTDMFKTSLGPRGMLKLLLQSFPIRDQVTSDGKTILMSLGPIHPGAQLLREMAYSQISVGDGVITTLVFAGELLKNAKKLIDLRVRPAVIVHGYLQALKYSLRTLREELSVPVDLNDVDTILKVAVTAAGTKSTGLPVANLANFAATAVNYVKESRAGRPYVDLRNICVIKRIGRSGEETRLIRGIAFERGLRHPSMPKKIEGVRIALLKCGLEFRKPWEEKTTMKIELAPGKIGSMQQARFGMVRANVEKISRAGANVVVIKNVCDELHASLLAERDIQAVHRIPDEGGIGRLAKASGGTPVGTIDDLRPEDLGYAEIAEEVDVPRFDTKRLDKEVKTPDGSVIPEVQKMFVIDGCKDLKSVTILIRGELESLVTESERALDASLAACQALVKESRIVGGAGSLEAELALRIRKFALNFENKTQMAVMAYAEAIEGVTLALAENAGLDRLDAKIKIRVAHSRVGGTWMGIDLLNKRLCDAFELGVIDPLLIKESAIKIASEAACAVIRIDRILAGESRPKLLPGEIPPGASEGPDVLKDAKDLPDETIKAFKKSKFVKPYGNKLELNL